MAFGSSLEIRPVIFWLVKAGSDPHRLSTNHARVCREECMYVRRFADVRHARTFTCTSEPCTSTYSFYANAKGRNLELEPVDDKVSFSIHSTHQDWLTHLNATNYSTFNPAPTCPQKPDICGTFPRKPKAAKHSSVEP